MKIVDLDKLTGFKEKKMNRELVHDNYTFRILNFNFEPGQELPIHSHPADSELALQVLEGEGFFLGEDEEIPAKAGDLLIGPVSEPHGVRATTRMRVLVTIAPPI